MTRPRPFLAGDALLTLAFDVLADRRTAPSPAVRIELVRLLAQGAGIGGMVGGQMFDLAAEGRYPGIAPAKDAEAAIIRIQSMKTGALIVAAAAMGATLGGATARQRNQIASYARALGLAFQIRDDLLDAEGDPALVGKATRKDAAAGKATFVSLEGLEGARRRLAMANDAARTSLAPFGAKAALLAMLLDYNLARKS